MHQQWQVSQEQAELLQEIEYPTQSELQDTRNFVTSFIANFSRAESKTRQQLMTEVEQINKAIRTLSKERNLIKYLLKRGSEGVNSSQLLNDFMKTICSCCGKFIHKLCFHCEHTKCNNQTCSRKKKQVLNARMLNTLKKMKEDRKRRTRSRDNKPKKIRRRKEEESECDEEELRVVASRVESEDDSESGRQDGQGEEWLGEKQRTEMLGGDWQKVEKLGGLRARASEILQYSENLPREAPLVKKKRTTKVRHQDATSVDLSGLSGMSTSDYYFQTEDEQ